MGRTRQQASSSAAAAAMERGKGKEKGKQAEKGRDARRERQKGREARKEKEKDSKKKGRDEAEQFFKVFFPEQSGERLKIPQPFEEYLEGEQIPQLVSLKGPSGNTWQAVLTSDSQGVGFTKGWKEFARDHSLLPYHFLIFTYDGPSQFSVSVFCASGVKDKAALDVQPRKEIAVKLEVEEGVLDVDVASTSEVSAPHMEVHRTTRKRVRKVNDEIENGSSPKRHSSAQKKPEKRKADATVDTSKAVTTVIDNNKDSSCQIDEYSGCNKTQITRSKDVPRIGTFASKKFREPVVISQRRPVTEEEKSHAFKRAKEFQSKNPFTVQAMMESYVYVGFFLNIPCQFVRESLPRASKKMTLWDPQGKYWEVNYVYYNDRGVAAFSGGWGKFALGNNLEKFDVCVFELFKEDNIKVHIYRVVPEITPLIRSSSM